MAAMNRKRLFDQLRGVLGGRAGLLAAYLFGSHAAEDVIETSDVDVAVLFDHPLPLADQIRLETALGEALGCPVDLIDVRQASPFLALDIIRGVRFVENDPVAADEYELYVLRRAGDLAPYERERRAMLLGAER